MTTTTSPEAPEDRRVLHGNPGHTGFTFTRATSDLRHGDRIVATSSTGAVYRGEVSVVYGSRGLALGVAGAGRRYLAAQHLRAVEPEDDYDRRLAAADAAAAAATVWTSLRAATVDEIANEIADARLAGDAEREAAARARLAAL